MRERVVAGRGDGRERSSRWASLGFAGCCVLLLATVAVRYAEPVQDGDLFWHLAYARQLIAHGTLVPDHAAFSWTPASNRMIYCAWAAELLFYGVWRCLGLAGLFALRYAVPLLALALLWRHARSLGLGRSALTAVLLFVLALASPIAMAIKPQLLSFLFMNLVVWSFFHARRTGWTSAAGPLYLVPAVVVLWVNCHGAFLLVAPFLAATALGELRNRRSCPEVALSPRLYRRLLASWGAAALLVLANPYGARYPLQLAGDLLPGAPPRPDLLHNAEYQDIFAGTAVAFHFVDFLVLMSLLLAILLVRRRAGAAGAGWDRGIDWTVLLANLAYAPFYVALVRATLFWPPVFAYSALELAAGARAAGAEDGEARIVAAPARGAGPASGSKTGGQRRRRSESPPAPAGVQALFSRSPRISAWWRPLRTATLPRPSAGATSAGSMAMPPWSGRRAPSGVVTVVFSTLVLFLALRAGHEAWRRPYYSSYLGFGVSYVSPVVEAEFLDRYPIGPRLYNLYDSGGYLLWRLDPRYKVMTDSRAFPYLGWFADQESFTRGETFASFMERYPARVAVIDLVNSGCIHNFTQAPFWRLAFYGPTAAIFVRDDVVLPASATAFAPDRLRHLRNADTAARVFDFALSIADYPAAWQVLRQLETRLRPQMRPGALDAALTYRAAHRALAAGEYPRAQELFARAFSGPVGRAGRELSTRDRLILRLLERITAPVPPGQPPPGPGLSQALSRLAAPDRG